MKTTAFTKFHEALGARMVPFAGYNMPVEYVGINEEHQTCREKIGIFDVSHMGEFWVNGPKAASFIQSVTSNDVTALFDGKVQYSCFPNDNGGIVDDLLVYRFSEEKYLLVVNASNIEKDWNWCVKHAQAMGLEIGKELTNNSDEICQLAVQGPYALKAMQKLTEANVIDMEYYTVKEISFAGIDKVIFSTTGYTGAGGCEIYAYNADADKLWNAVLDACKEFGGAPVGLAARDTLRLEMGFCLYGNDINDTTSPIEAGLGWITKFTDNNNFPMRAHHENLKNEGVTQRLKGFVLTERGIPRQHYKVVDAEGTEIGEVTSGTMSPMMKQGIGMAYLAKGFWKEGTEIFIEIRNKKVRAEVVKLPIYKGQMAEVKG
jgi:aminomethyltransferase